MNDYREIRIDVDPCSETVTDIFAQLLCEIGYESFVADEKGLTAYVKDELFDRESLNGVIDDFPIEGISVEVADKFVEGRDWNSEWEKNYFRPIVVGDRCVIHSSFHSDYPECLYDIVIDPKMAFGTGHHQTTSLIIEYLLTLELEGKKVVDMGTGTGILAILAAMRGSRDVTAVEIDPFACRNAVENVGLNGHGEIKVVLGDASLLKEIGDVDLFIANINRNIITADMGSYVATLKKGSRMILSGFYVDDIEIVGSEAEKYGMKVCGHTEKDRWAALELLKN